MTNRIKLDASGLKISKPGVDVVSALAVGLQFSSDWSGMGIYQRGSLSFNWNVLSSTAGNFSAIVPLNKTFASIPFVLFLWKFAGADAVLGYGDGFSLVMDRGEPGPAASSRWAATGQVSTTNIDFRGIYAKQTFGVVSPAMDLSYIVFDNNY